MKRLGHIGSDHFPMLVELALVRPLELATHPTEDRADEALLEETLQTEVAAQADAPSMRNIP